MTATAVAPSTSTKHAQPAAQHWRLADLGLVIAAKLLLTVAVAVPFALALPDADTTPIFTGGGGHLAALLNVAPGLLVIWWVAGRSDSRRHRHLGLNRPRRIPVVPTLLCLALVAYKLLIGAAAAANPAISAALPVGQGWGDPDATAADIALNLLTAGLLVGLAEELFYRGVILGYLRQRLHPAIAVAISAVVFGLVHGLAQAPSAAVIGILLGWLYLRSGSLWPGIVAHAAINASTILMWAALVP